jgi:CRP-like cAMP-binding protein
MAGYSIRSAETAPDALAHDRPHRNRILASLPSDDLAFLRSLCERVTFNKRQTLQIPDRSIGSVYFPEQGFASVIAVSGKRHSGEVAMIGHEGVIGSSIVLPGGDPSSVHIVAATDGHAYRISAQQMRRVAQTRPSISAALQRFAHVLSSQIANTALANAAGSIDAKLARWLLMAHDRLGSGELLFTHEEIASSLSVRRAGITAGLRVFQSREIVCCRRGTIKIKSRAQLLKAADGLYAPEEQLIANDPIIRERATTEGWINVDGNPSSTREGLGIDRAQCTTKFPPVG